MSDKTVEALEYLFIAVVTRADSDYLFRAVNRADEALRLAMPGWTAPVPMTMWHKESDLMAAVEQILDAGHMDQEDLARLRAAWEAL